MSAKNIAIRAENISKCYRIGLKEKMHNSLGGAMLDFVRSPLRNYRTFRSLYTFGDVMPGGNGSGNSHAGDVIWAVRDASFEVREGEVLGIIGKNGAGKSTLLKILCRITEPTGGRAEIRGRVSSLLEVGTGFHPELTGRENVYLNGTVLGMKKREIDRKFDEIIDFSGVERFIDTPVKRYSSGMKVRLAFAVAAHLEPEILVIDEVLAVGDAEFQRKCLGKMQDISTQGRTVLFVSHNMGAIIDLCPSSILLQGGKITDRGPSKEIVEGYLSSLFVPVDNRNLDGVTARKGNGILRFHAVHMENGAGSATSLPISGSPLDIVIEYASKEDLTQVQFMITVFNHMGIAVTHCHVDSGGQRFTVPKGQGRVVCRIPKLPLPNGHYKISASASNDAGLLDFVPTACIFDVEKGNFFKTSYMPSARYATALVEHSWEMTSDRVEAN